LIYTSYADVNEIYRAAWVGAAGFLLKGEPAEELVEAVRAVGRGNVLMDRSTVAMRNNLDRDSNPILTARVTYRERDILRLLADGLSNREIARKLVIAISTVENYVDSILNKLNVQSRTQAALLAADHLAKPYVW
jgi:DNA-binding NarL/FixJ family response regulator